MIHQIIDMLVLKDTHMPAEAQAILHNAEVGQAREYD
jgi:hypothetical protein